ncbi:imidazole glycerol phosphate synthase subunit HisH [Endozoicomonas sp. Mp262]|uniref:imidazole glycerol phosphate synthase subunit HisH n=1 Tax=Endozoicomonas sp. Mp262 TaxID=2919499 RepID=UPI0021DAD177
MAGKKQTVVIIDTGCANILSVRYAIERLDYKVVVSYAPDVLINADKLFLPGVGTAQEAMKNLEKRQLTETLKQIDKPMLGICLGMQLLCSFSEEKNKKAENVISCLGFCEAPVRKMDVASLPLPHMGWNRVIAIKDHPLFNGISPGSFFYFVHSYAIPFSHHDGYTIANCQYGEWFSAAIQKDNYHGVQFHPERSGKVGSQLIKNFLEL